MHTSSIELYDLLKDKIGEREAKTLVAFVEHEVENKFEQKKDVIATKQNIADVRVEMREMKAEIIKWMFIFLVGQAGVIIGALIAAMRLFIP